MARITENCVFFDGFADVVQFAKPMLGDSWYDASESFLGYKAPSQMEAWLTSPHPLSKEIAANVNALNMESVGQTIGHDVSGFCPDVAAYLSGEPEYMLSMVDGQDTRAPLRVCVFADYNWSVSAQKIASDLKNVYIDLLGIALHRPVQLQVCNMAERLAGNGVKYYGSSAAIDLNASADSASVAPLFDVLTIRAAFYRAVNSGQFGDRRGGSCITRASEFQTAVNLLGIEYDIILKSDSDAKASLSSKLKKALESLDA